MTLISLLNPLRCVLLILLMTSALCQASPTQQITDLAGRQVTVPKQIQRIILGEGRFLTALSIIAPEIAQHKIVGMLGEMERYDPATWLQFTQVYPTLKQIPTIGGKGANSFSLEKAIALQPDVAIFSLQKGHGPTQNNQLILQTLERAGIPVLFIDFRQQPLVNTQKSMAILGQLLNAEARATAFNQLYQQALDQVTQGLATVTTAKPKVFLHSRVGLFSECCESIAQQMFADFIQAAGGDNMAQHILPGDHGIVNIEYLLKQQPDLYIGTAIGHVQQGSQSSNQLLAGAFIDEATLQQSLRKVKNTQGFEHLTAIQNGHMHTLWHHFYMSPFNVVAVQVMAQWFYPKSFAHLKPDQLLSELHQRFLPFERNGVYWGTLDTGSTAQ